MRLFSFFSRPRRDDHHEVGFSHTKTLPTWQQWRRLFTVFNSRERRVVILLCVVALLNALLLGWALYRRITVLVPRLGGEYREALVGQPHFLNPILGETNDVDRDLVRLIFSSLLKRNSDGTLIPDLATSFETSEDQKTYTVTLREDALWHDGQPVTTGDVRFTIESMQDKSWGSPLAKQFQGVTVTISDERTIQFSLREVFPRFPEALTVGILPKHLWEQIPTQNRTLAALNIKPIGSGAWMFRSFTKDKLGTIKTYTLDAFPKFYGDKPHLERLALQFYDTADLAVAAVQKDPKLNLAFLPKRLRDQLTETNTTTLISLSLPQYTALFFQQKNNEALQEVLMRRALMLALDRQAIIHDVLRDDGQVINGPIPPGFSGAHGNENAQGAKPEEAEELLTKAGWKRVTKEEYVTLLDEQKKQKEKEQERLQRLGRSVTPETEKTEEDSTELPDLPVYRVKNVKRLSLTITTTENKELQDVADHIKKQWGLLGIDTTITTVPLTLLETDVLRPRKYEILLTGILFSSQPDLYPFWHSSQIKQNGLNLASFANKEADRLLEDLRKTVKPEEQGEKLKQFQDILVKELPAIFLYTPTYTYVQRSFLKGFSGQHINVPADRFLSLSSWYIKTKRVLR